MMDLIGILINAMILVESAGNPAAIGDQGRAVGVLQVHRIVVDDVNRILGVSKFNYEDRKDPEKSKEICRIYLTYWSERFKVKTGKEANLSDMARIWNGGPNGWKKEHTWVYWFKVKKVIGEKKKR